MKSATSTGGSFTLGPSSRRTGSVSVPGDKSVSHRALLLAAMTNGESTIAGLSGGDDVLRTRAIIEALGAATQQRDELVVVAGPPGGLQPSKTPLDCGNSGTAMRLLAGLLAGLDGTSVLTGDASLSRRPMDRVAAPLEQMGARLSGTGSRCLPPVTIEGGGLRSITYDVPVPSAQVKSAVLVAALFADGPTTVIERTLTRVHTEEMLAAAGAAIEVSEVGTTRTITVTPTPLAPRHWQVPGDPSQSAFWVVGGLLGDIESSVTVHSLYDGPQRSGYLDVLAAMGATIMRQPDGEGTFSVTVCGGEPLVGIDVDAAMIPSLDEVPILAVAAAWAQGRTRFCDVGELRVKETDRLEATAALCRSLGCVVVIEGDDLIISGRAGARFEPFTLDPDGDHRIAMAGAIAALSMHSGTATIDDPGCIATSYPTFLATLDEICDAELTVRS